MGYKNTLQDNVFSSLIGALMSLILQALDVDLIFNFVGTSIQNKMHKTSVEKYSTLLT